ncbi:hypothetical protein D3C76_1401380 [compost metagenome]
MVVIEAKSMKSGQTAWRSASPNGGWVAKAANTIRPTFSVPSTIMMRSMAIPARCEEKIAMATSALNAPPHLGSRPVRAFRPRPAPAMLPRLNTRPPNTTSTVSR